MTLQWAGLILSGTTFATIGIGHVLVRRLYPIVGVKAGPVCWLLGLITYYGSIQAASDLLSGVLGVVAITLVWDGIEFFRQRRRVARGEA